MGLMEIWNLESMSMPRIEMGTGEFSNFVEKIKIFATSAEKLLNFKRCTEIFVVILLICKNLCPGKQIGSIVIGIFI